MIMMIIATSFLFGSVLTNLYIAQTLAQQIVALEVNRWVIMGLINVCCSWGGCFLPPVAIILIICPDPASHHHRHWISIPSGSVWS
ncbi:MAG: TRAP transporter large permease subunit [Deltaproteobacteria bacterium]|nr:TRAP transporter large permease subunit [Deltaproteobacteria bacterium]